jgi:non-ribosomal peptide synthetase component F
MAMTPPRVERIPPVMELIEARMRECPDDLAVADAFGGRLTYSDLDRRSAAVAAYLMDTGAKADSVIALAVPMTTELIASIVGVTRAGAAYLPLETRDPRARQHTLVDDAGADIVLVADAQAPAWAGHDRVVRMSEVATRRPATRAAWPATPPQALAYVRYTSGSGGGAKGVGVTLANLSAYVAQVTHVLTPQAGDVFCMLQPITFDSCLTMLYPALATGGTLWLVPPDLAADPQWMHDHLRVTGTDFMKITPSHLAALQAGEVTAADLMPRKALVLGGEPSRWEWFTTLRDLRPGCAIITTTAPPRPPSAWPH